MDSIPNNPLGQCWYKEPNHKNYTYAWRWWFLYLQ